MLENLDQLLASEDLVMPLDLGAKGRSAALSLSLSLSLSPLLVNNIMLILLLCM